MIEISALKLFFIVIGSMASGGCFMAWWINRELETKERELDQSVNKDLANKSWLLEKQAC